jgi:hypothetical protein
MKFLTRKGFLLEEQGTTYFTETPDLALGPLQAAACTYRIAVGPRAGQNVLSLPNRSYTRSAAYSGVLCQRVGLSPDFSPKVSPG